MQAYLINLARSPERRAHMEAELSKAGIQYEMVEAVDGRDLDLEDPEVVDRGAIANGSFRLGAGGPGAAGCALSHLRVYQKVVADGHDLALVLEDDISLPGDLSELVEAVVGQMGGAEVVLLNFHSPAPCRVSRQSSIPLPKSRLLVEPVDMSQPKSTGAYIITRQACVNMAAIILPVRVTADDWEYFCQEGAISRLRCVVPMPVTNSPNFRSTIDFYEPRSWQGRLRQMVARGRLPLVRQVLAMRRRRTFRRLGFTGKVEFVDSNLTLGAERHRGQ